MKIETRAILDLSRRHASLPVAYAVVAACPLGLTGSLFGQMFESISHTTELLAASKKKKAVDPNAVPTFQAAIANPNAAMEQVLAMRSSKAVKHFAHSYDQRSSARTLPW